MPANSTVTSAVDQVRWTDVVLTVAVVWERL